MTKQVENPIDKVEVIDYSKDTPAELVKNPARIAEIVAQMRARREKYYAAQAEGIKKTRKKGKDIKEVLDEKVD
jgi:hypothetical protein